MNKSYKITILLLTSTLSMGLITNRTHAAAARTSYTKTKRAPQDIARDYVFALQNNEEQVANDLAQEGVNGQLALHIAIMEGHIDAMSNLMNTQQADIYDLLSDAIKNKDVACVRAIGAVFDILIGALFDAAEDGELETVRILVEAGVDVNAANNDPVNKCTCKTLAHAARGGQKEVVQFLLDHGAEINAASETGFTALMTAVQYGHENIVQLLIERGADINARDENENTALWYAITTGYANFVQLFLDHQADTATAVQYFKHMSPTNMASNATKEQIAQQLIRIAHIFADTKKGNKTAVQNAIAAMNEEARIKYINSLLFVAVEEGDYSMTEFLLDQGASTNLICLESSDLNSTNTPNNDSILMIAVTSDQLDIAQLLISRGADVNYADKKNCTALECAVLNGDFGLVNLLINAHANVNCAIEIRPAQDEGNEQPNNRPNSLLELAVRSNYIEIMEQLIEAGAYIQPSTFTHAYDNGTIAQILIKGLLIQLMRLQTPHLARLGMHNNTTKNIDGDCGSLTPLSGDILNRVLWYAINEDALNKLDSRDLAALRCTCRAMSQLQPDNIGLSATLRQATSIEFLKVYEKFNDVIIQDSIKILWKELVKFLQKEITSPVNDINKWKASVEHRIKTGTSLLSQRRKGSFQQALTGLIEIVKAYYKESIKLVQTPAAIAQSVTTPENNQRETSIASQDGSQSSNPDEQLRQAIALSLEQNGDQDVEQYEQDSCSDVQYSDDEL